MLTNILEPPVQHHLKKVYTCLSMSTAAACIGAYVHLFTGILQGSFLTSLAAMGCALTLMATPHEPKKQNMRLGLLLAFSFCSGLGLGPLLELTITVNPSLIATAFLGTSVIFVCFSLSALYNRNRDYLYLGGVLMSALCVLTLVGLANIFAQSLVVSKTLLYVGLIIVCGFVLYDTQMIIEKRRAGDTDYIWHSVLLFIDFLDIFRHLLVILLQSQDTQKRRKRDRD